MSLMRCIKYLYQASVISGRHRLHARCCSPLSNRFKQPCHHRAFQYPRSLNLWLFIVSRNKSPVFPLNHKCCGGRKPCLFQRVLIISGNIPFMLCRRRRLVCVPPMRIFGARESDSSAMRWSQNGSRTSRECAIELRSP